MSSIAKDFGVGSISPSMNVNTKPSHKMMYFGYWINIDGNMPLDVLSKLVAKIKLERTEKIFSLLNPEE